MREIERERERGEHAERKREKERRESARERMRRKKGGLNVQKTKSNYRIQHKLFQVKKITKKR